MKLKPLLLPLSLLTVLTLILVISSCKEFIEPSISKRQIQPNAPANQYQSTSYTLNFWWGDVDDALAYRLQIVTPKFDSIGGLIIDTLVHGTKFSTTMDPGNYEWHVRAENGSTQTEYSSPRSFTVLASSLTDQTLILSSPGNNSMTNNGSITFKWNNLYNATKYHLQIDSNSFADESSLVKDQVIPGQQFTFKLPGDQVYQWRVRAENETEQSKWSVINQVTYDGTPPPQVTLNQPLDNAQLSLPVALSWITAPTAAKYKLSVFQADGHTPLNNTFPMLLSTGSFSFNTGSSGDRISWQVSAIDAAGNESQPSELKSFVLQ